MLFHRFSPRCLFFYWTFQIPDKLIIMCIYPIYVYVCIRKNTLGKLTWNLSGVWMIKFLMACLNTSVAEHKLCILLYLTWLLSATPVDTHGDKKEGPHWFYQNRIIYFYLHCNHSYSFLELTFSSPFPNLSESFRTQRLFFHH